MVIDFHQAISDKFRLLSTLYSDEDFPEALACGPTSKPWTGRWTSNMGYKGSRGGGGFICCHALAMAAGHCAAGFCHQLPACRRWYRQQQRQWQGRRDNHDCHCCGEEAPSSLRQGPSPWHEPLQPSLACGCHMHSSQGTAHNPSQGTAQVRQAVGSWRRQGPDQPPLGVHRQHPQRKHDSADPSKTTHVQAWGCPASPRQTVSLTVKPYWWTAASRAWRLTGISKMGGDRQRGVQYRQPQAGKWIPQLPWHSTTGICLHRTVAVVMSSSSPERQQQLSVIRKYALARSATLRDLLECPRGPHHSTTAAAPTKKEKAATASLLSTLLGLRLIAWPRRMATLLAHGGRSGTSAGWLQSPGRWRTPFTPPPQKGHQRGENGYYRTSIINWTQSFTWGAAGNIMQPPCQWHSGWLPCVGTLPGPLP